MTATETKPENLDAWRRLYAAADLVKKLAPWTFMEETDAFGVQFPGSDEIGYISIMGALGQHLAVTVYMGDDAANQFLSIAMSDGDNGSAEQILEVPQLMLSFEDRELIEKQDRDIIKALGLKYRGRGNWPLFRSYRPGYCPWFLEKDEIDILTTVLEQVAGVAMRVEDDPSILHNDDDRNFLVRTLNTACVPPVWEDIVRPLPPPTPIALDFRVDELALARLATIESGIKAAEVAFVLTPMSVGGPGQRPMLTYILIVVEPESFFVLGIDVMQAEEGLPAMWETIPAKLIAILNQAEIKPGEIRVSSPRLHQFLSPILDDLDIELTPVNALPAAEDAINSLQQYMQNQ